MSNPLSVRSRHAVDAELRRLHGDYGEFPVFSVTNVNDPEFFEHGVDYVESGHRGATGARVTNAEGKLLLTREARAPDTWILPGGGHEPGESFEETAARELWEEASVDIAVTGVWRAERKRFVHREEPERRGYLLVMFFTAEPIGGEAGVYPERWDEGNEEVLEAKWFEDVPENALPAVTDPLAPLE